MQLLATAPTPGWLVLLDIIALVGQQERPLMFAMAGLPAPFLLSFRLLGRWFGMQMLRARRA